MNSQNILDVWPRHLYGIQPRRVHERGLHDVAGQLAMAQPRRNRPVRVQR